MTQEVENQNPPTIVKRGIWQLFRAIFSKAGHSARIPAKPLPIYVVEHGETHNETPEERLAQFRMEYGHNLTWQRFY